MTPLTLHASALLVLSAASGVAATGGASTTTTLTAPPCQGDRWSWTASFGDCANYVQGLPNHFYCDSDSDGTFTAEQVCPECDLCVYEETIQPSRCHGDASSFDVGYGGCGTYAQELNYNWGFCRQDVDSATGRLAYQVCSECGLCHPQSPSEEGEGPNSAAVGAVVLLLLLLGAVGGALALWSRRRRRASDFNTGSNAFVAKGNRRAPPATADGASGHRQMDWDVDRELRSGLDQSAQGGIAEAEQSNGFMGMATNPPLV